MLEEAASAGAPSSSSNDRQGRSQGVKGREVSGAGLSARSQARVPPGRGGWEEGLAQLDESRPQVGEGGEDAVSHPVLKPWRLAWFPEPPAPRPGSKQLPEGHTTAGAIRIQGPQQQPKRRSARGS